MSFDPRAYHGRGANAAAADARRAPGSPVSSIRGTWNAQGPVDGETRTTTPAFAVGRRAAVLAVMTLALHPHGASAQASSGVRDAEVRYGAALMSGDVETAVSFLAQSGTFVAGDCARIQGRQGARSFLAGLVRSGVGVALTPQDLVQTDGREAREVGTLRLTGSRPEAWSRDARYTTTWVKRGTDWLVSAMEWTPRGSADGDRSVEAVGDDRCYASSPH